MCIINTKNDKNKVVRVNLLYHGKHIGMGAVMKHLSELFSLGLYLNLIPIFQGNFLGNIVLSPEMRKRSKFQLD